MRVNIDIEPGRVVIDIPDLGALEPPANGAAWEKNTVGPVYTGGPDYPGGYVARAKQLQDLANIEAELRRLKAAYREDAEVSISRYGAGQREEAVDRALVALERYTKGLTADAGA